jgi:hypothetical protein
MKTVEVYDNEEFKAHFRMNRKTCDFVILVCKYLRLLIVGKIN